MPQPKSKKILIYIFLFIIITTFNNKNFNNINFGNINNILVKGLEGSENFQLIENLNFIKSENILFLNRVRIKDVIEKNTLVEDYSVFRLYPSSLNIIINKTNFLAVTEKDGNIFLLGSNGKMTLSDEINHNLPFIFGDFNIENFFELKNAMDESNFDFKNVKNLFFFKSGRWDIETKKGYLIRLPNKGLKKSLKTFISFFEMNNTKEIKEIDLRQNNQIITNE